MIAYSEYPLHSESDAGLLIRLSEECAEVIKDCAKALRFGLDNHHPREEFRNSRKIANELADVLAIREELFRRELLP